MPDSLIYGAAHFVSVMDEWSFSFRLVYGTRREGIVDFAVVAKRQKTGLTRVNVRVRGALIKSSSPSRLRMCFPKRSVTRSV